MTRPPPPDEPDQAARLAAEIAELLDVLWEHSREVTTAPLSASQLRAMFALERAEGANLRTLVAMLGSTPPSVSRLYDRLEAVGLVERGASAASRREVELRLSPRGREYLRDLRGRRVAVLREVVDQLSPAARSALVDGLTEFHAAARGRAPHGTPADGTP
ncbi:MarR family winged helix-turn-helix transcriptional regulator [Amycolatopsis magusensis]|uniref:MarR family winged helix-turn-helix transcriptional regulator n=1 Tax=Amycolatopsis magusensis TaxID=882444 RepID=UPI0037B1E51E